METKFLFVYEFGASTRRSHQSVAAPDQKPFLQQQINKRSANGKTIVGGFDPYLSSSDILKLTGSLIVRVIAIGTVNGIVRVALVRVPKVIVKVLLKAKVIVVVIVIVTVIKVVIEIVIITLLVREMLMVIDLVIEIEIVVGVVIRVVGRISSNGNRHGKSNRHGNSKGNRDSKSNSNRECTISI